MARPDASRASSPSDAAWNIPLQRSSGIRPAGPDSKAEGGLEAVTGSSGEASSGAPDGGRGPSRTLWYRREHMQTAPQRRPRHRPARAPTRRGRGGRGRPAITQQLVRDRLLPPEAFTGSVYDRKIREIIQSIRLTQAFPGQDGKQKIIEAYLNQNFYGNQSYGIKAAAVGYFGASDMSKLTLAQDALLAAIPKSPTQYDLVRNAVSQCTVTPPERQDCPAGKRQLVVPATSAVLVRRNEILDFMKTRIVLSGSR